MPREVFIDHRRGSGASPDRSRHMTDAHADVAKIDRQKLERDLREATNRIQDESVRRHYGQAIRERINAHFGAPQQGRGGNRGRNGAYGGAGKARAAAA